jgi:hypothetical protein
VRSAVATEPAKLIAGVIITGKAPDAISEVQMIIGPPDTATNSPTTFQLAVQLVQAFAWPAVAVIAIAVFYKPIRSILEALRKRMDTGASIEIYQVKVGQAPNNLPAAAAGETLTADHMALIHSSWRYPKKDTEFGVPMWAFHVIVQAREEVLNRIESVKYLLDPSYPNPVQVVTDRLSRFKLKELANGESTVRCEVKVKGQPELVKLQRYINLTNTGPRI